MNIRWSLVLAMVAVGIYGNAPEPWRTIALCVTGLLIGWNILDRKGGGGR